MPSRRVATLMLAMATLAAACSGGGGSGRGDLDLSQLDPTPTSTPTATPEVAATPAAEPENPDVVTGPAAADRLVVIGNDGDLAVMDADGGNVAVLAEADGEVFVSQPAWSPDGRRLAWLQTSTVTAETFVESTNADGSNLVRTVVGFPGFYTAWDPTSARIAVLGNSPDGIAFAVAELGVGEAQLLDEQVPYYFAWAPDGSRVLAHAGPDLSLIDVGGSATGLGPAGEFNAPWWAADGANVIYAVPDSGGGLLVRAAPDGAGRVDLLTYVGAAQFVLDPTGRRLAIQAVGDPTSDGGETDVQAAFGAQADVQVLPEGLHVLDLETGELAQVSVDPRLGFFWSPSGERLLSLLVELDGNQVWTRWEVWDGEPVSQTNRVLPSELFASVYLPFFDQYAQSLTFWSPDEMSFVYVGRDEAGNDGVWVADAAVGTSELVSPGAFAAWSPT